MPDKEKLKDDLIADLWRQFRACLLHATATPAHIAKWQRRVDEVLK
jgi:hypothetical protein